jgi:hypothetical protein
MEEPAERMAEQIGEGSSPKQLAKETEPKKQVRGWKNW